MAVGPTVREVDCVSGMIPSHDIVVVREGDAEIVGGAPVTGRLYADSSVTGGALSSQRITLLRGAAGATPHHHTGSSEMFYVVSGAAEMLTGERVLTVRGGDLVVVPPGTVHAFAAAAASDADLLIILTPGVERFGYFRHLHRIASGEAPLESILEVQDLYDNHFDDSLAWQQTLAARL
jgi:mannose-6-phosphate isomerase-like protein (cupin superfamily)